MKRLKVSFFIRMPILACALVYVIPSCNNERPFTWENHVQNFASLCAFA